MSDAAMVGKPRYVREDADAYFTPAWCTEALLKRWSPVGAVWEPAAGRGDMAKVLTDSGYNVFATDLHEHKGAVTQIKKDIDFLEPSDFLMGCFSIVTNPPYTLAERFIRRALEVTAPGRGSVAMLLRHEYDCAKTRRDLFAEHPHFARKITLIRRPRWFADTKTSPRHSFAWYVWDARHRGPAVLEWAP